MVARPAAMAGEVVAKHPETAFPPACQLTVGSDDVCVVTRYGQTMGLVQPGQYPLDPSALPFLASCIEQRPTGPVLAIEVFFVSTRSRVDNQMGGPLGNLPDPQTGAAAKVAMFGTYSFRVEDPDALITSLSGMGKLEPGAIESYVKTVVMKVAMETFLPTVLQNRWPLAELVAGAHLDELGAGAVMMLKNKLSSMGIAPIEVKYAKVVAPGVPAAAAPAPGPGPGSGLSAGMVPSAGMSAGHGSAVAPGQRVLAYYEDGWYEATVAGVDARSVHINWDDGTSSPVEPDAVRQLVMPGPGKIQAGQRVMARYEETFYEATVGAVSPGQVGISWDDGTESWVPEGDVRLIF